MKSESVAPDAIQVTDRRAHSLADRWIERRVSLIWALLVFNTLTPIGGATVIPIPYDLARLLTAAALGVAVLLALTLNPRLLIRPNLVLALYLLLAAVSLMASIRGTAGVGALFRCARLTAFLGVLWLLTPWWGRRDLLLARCHLRTLVGVCASVVLGLIIAPSAARSVDGRLSGALWPIWPTAVAHYAALMAGMAIVLWLSRSMAGTRAAVLGAGGFAMVVLSHTRVASVALVTGVICAGLTLLVARRRARRVLIVGLLVAPLAAVVLAPTLSAYLTRGQTAEEISDLTGRKQVWELIIEAPRSTFDRWFGSGLSDKSFQGRPIDNGWLAAYQDQGFVGVAIVGCIAFFLLVAPAFRPTGTARALAVFIIVYCLIDSYTEVGIADASPYMLDLVVAASLLAADRGVDESEDSRSREGASHT